RRVSREHLRERALAGAVRAHDRVDLARVDGEVEALENFFIAYGGVEIFDFEHSCHPTAAQRRRDLLSLAVASQARIAGTSYFHSNYTTITIDPSAAPRRWDDNSYPTLPSNVIPNRACASNANSIGSS